MLETVRAELRFVPARARLEHDAGEDVLAVHGVGNAHGRRLEHRGMAHQRFVDLARRDVLAALDDQLLQPAGDEVEAIDIAITEIARREPAIDGENLRGALRILVITGHDALAAKLDLASFAVPEHAPVRRDDARLD